MKTTSTAQSLLQQTLKPWKKRSITLFITANECATVLFVERDFSLVRASLKPVAKPLSVLVANSPACSGPPPGADKILAFRCIHQSRRLDSFWKDHLNRCAAKNDPLALAA